MWWYFFVTYLMEMYRSLSVKIEHFFAIRILFSMLLLSPQLGFTRG